MNAKPFWKSQAGNVGMLAALAAVPLLGAAGAAMDMGRANEARTRVYSALDAAVLAGTQDLLESNGNQSQAISVANKFYSNKINASEFTTHSVTFKLNSAGDGIAAQGKIEIGTSFLSVVGITNVSVLSDSVAEAASASASRGAGGDLEIVMMLDATGSMCDDGNGPCSSATKLNALKLAANDLVDIVLPDGSTGDNTRIALVPFSTRVRVGPDGGSAIGDYYMKKLTNMDPERDYWQRNCTNWISTGSGTSEDPFTGYCAGTESNLFLENQKIIPCVADRNFDATDNFDVTENPPGFGSWFVGYDGSRAPLSYDASDTPMASEAGYVETDPSPFYTYSEEAACYEAGPNNIIVPLTNDKSALTTRISSLTGNGATSGVLGTALSWYMISPNWSSIWPSESTPAAYSKLKSNGGNLRKIAVLMSDGAYNTKRAWKGQNTTTMSNVAKTYCDNMKEEGIEIFTVGFDFGSIPTAEQAIARDTLRSCASSPAQYYDTDNSAELRAAFENIGSQLSEQHTRLTK